MGYIFDEDLKEMVRRGATKTMYKSNWMYVLLFLSLDQLVHSRYYTIIFPGVGECKNIHQEVIVEESSSLPSSLCPPSFTTRSLFSSSSFPFSLHSSFLVHFHPSMRSPSNHRRALGYPFILSIEHESNLLLLNSVPYIALSLASY